MTTDTLDTSDTLAVNEVAALLHVSPRTIRRWIDAGKLPATQGRGRGGAELRVPRHAALACRMLLPTSDRSDTSTSDTPDEKPATSDTLDRLRRERDGAHLAARIAAQRMGAAHGTIARMERERAHLVSEIAFLRDLVTQQQRTRRKLWPW